MARDLYGRGIAVVVIDPRADDELHRETNPRCPVIVGDATRPVILHRAGIERARALVACTSNDALNLEIGLIAQSVAEASRGRPPDGPPHDAAVQTRPDLTSGRYGRRRVARETTSPATGRRT